MVNVVLDASRSVCNIASRLPFLTRKEPHLALILRYQFVKFFLRKVRQASEILEDVFVVGWTEGNAFCGKKRNTRQLSEYPRNSFLFLQVRHVNFFGQVICVSCTLTVQFPHYLCRVYFLIFRVLKFSKCPIEIPYCAPTLI